MILPSSMDELVQLELSGASGDLVARYLFADIAAVEIDELTNRYKILMRWFKANMHWLPYVVEEFNDSDPPTMVIVHIRSFRMAITHNEGKRLKLF